MFMCKKLTSLYSYATAAGVTKFRRVPLISFDNVMKMSIYGLTPAIVAAPLIGETAAIFGAFLWSTYITHNAIKKKSM